MSYRTCVNDIQIFGNNEYYPQWMEFLEQNGIHPDEEGNYDGYLTEFMPVLEVMEAISMQIYRERKREREKFLKQLERRKPKLEDDDYRNRKKHIENRFHNMFDLSHIPESVIKTEENPERTENEMANSLFDELALQIKNGYAFLPVMFYDACRCDLELENCFAYPNHFYCYRLKSGHAIHVHARITRKRKEKTMEKQKNAETALNEWLKRNSYREGFITFHTAGKESRDPEGTFRTRYDNGIILEPVPQEILNLNAKNLTEIKMDPLRTDLSICLEVPEKTADKAKADKKTKPVKKPYMEYTVILAMDPDRKQVLLRKKDHGCCEGLWNGIGARLHTGETETENAHRAFRKKTGMPLTNLTMLGTIQTRDMCLHYYTGTIRRAIRPSVPEFKLWNIRTLKHTIAEKPYLFADKGTLLSFFLQQTESIKNRRKENE